MMALSIEEIKEMKKEAWKNFQEIDAVLKVMLLMSIQQSEAENDEDE